MGNYFVARHAQARSQEKGVLFVLTSAFMLSVATVFAVILIGSSDKKSNAKDNKILPERLEVYTDIIVPVRLIREGEPLISNLFQRKSVKESTINSGAVKEIAFLDGKYAMTSLLPNYPVYEDFLAYNEPTGDIRDSIPDGYRAVTIRVDKITSLEGWVEPGAIVDITALTKINNELAAVPVAQSIKVLSVERRLAGKERPENINPETISLQVTPLEASRVIVAQATGMLHLTLRNDSDTKMGEDSIITQRDVFPSLSPVEKDPDVEGHVTIEGKEYPIKRGRIVIN